MLELYVLLLLIIILLIIIYYQDIKKIEPIIEKFNEDQWLDSCPGGYRTYYLDNGDAACCDGEIIANKCLGNSQCRLTGIGTKEMPNCVTIMNDLYGRKGRLLCPPSMQNYFRDKSKNRTGCTSDRLNSSSTAPISSQSPKCIIYPDEKTNQNKENSCFNQKELENTPCFGTNCKKMIIGTRESSPLIMVTFTDSSGMVRAAYTKSSLERYLNKVSPNWRNEGRFNLDTNIIVAEVAKKFFIDQTMSQSQISF